MPLAPLPVVLPLLAAALLLCGEGRMPYRWADLGAILIAAMTTLVAVVLAWQSWNQPIVYWFGGWRPSGGIALGISFVIDPAGAAVAAFAALLFTGTFIFGWHYFDEGRGRYQVLMLVFLAAMTGFCLSGDLFNFFVFFELMSVTAFAVTAYRQEASSIEGALNFTVMNMLGGFLMLGGIALLYGRTGALNLAQVGRATEAIRDDALWSMAFVLIFTGLLIKAAILPFHFWLADAHAVAPTPVCAIFSGIMVPVALFGASRIYWTVFSHLQAPSLVLHTLLFYLGAVTCVLGGLICLAQRHIKRLLAFSTVSHVGVMLVGCAALTPDGMAGFLLYLFGHGLTKGAMFMIAGILMSRHQNIDELSLRGKARDLPATGIACGIGGLLLAGLPLGMMGSGRAMIDAAAAARQPWVPYVLAFGSALTGAAVLRAAGRVFAGLGPEAGDEEQASSKAEGEKPRPHILMLVVVVVYLLIDIGTHGRILELFATRAALMFTASHAYASAVLDARSMHLAAPVAPAHAGPGFGWFAVLAALAISAFELWRYRLPAAIDHGAKALGRPLFKALDIVHSGHIGDYVAWMMAGLVLFAGAFIF